MTDKDILIIAYFLLGVINGIVIGGCFRHKL
jgi:hypothetical protein